MKIKFYLRVASQAFVLALFLPWLMGASNLNGGGCSSTNAIPFTVAFSGAHVSFTETSPQTVFSGKTLTLHLTPESGYTLLTNVEGDCPAGSWNETSFTTGAITQNCTLIFSAVPSENTVTVTPEAGANGSISPSSVQVVNSGDSITFTATPNAGYQVNEWLVDGTIAQNGDTTFQLNNITTNHTVTVSFSPLPAKFSYIANNGASGSLGDPTISSCAINPTSGLITSCQGAGGESVIAGIFANGIALNNEGTKIFLNSQDSLNANVYQCSVNRTDGTFSACTAILITSPTGYYASYGFLTLNPDNTLAYLIDGFNSRILACPMVSGTLSGVCSDTGASNIDDSMVGIVLNKAGTTAYIGNYDGFVTICSVSGTTFSGCVQHTGGGMITFSKPSGVALNNTESILYIADYNNNKVYGCSPNFSTCFVAANVPVAYGIALNEANTFVYVTNFTDTYMCQINNDGTFSACTIQSGFNVPIGIAFGY